MFCIIPYCLYVFFIHSFFYDSSRQLCFLFLRFSHYSTDTLFRLKLHFIACCDHWLLGLYLIIFFYVCEVKPDNNAHKQIKK